MEWLYTIVGAKVQLLEGEVKGSAEATGCCPTDNVHLSGATWCSATAAQDELMSQRHVCMYPIIDLTSGLVILVNFFQFCEPLE